MRHPDVWIDRDGEEHDVPSTAGKLKKGRVASHALLVAFVMERDGHACVLCSLVSDLVVDHIVSRRNGGSHHPDNLQVLCRRCNSMKAGLVDSLQGDTLAIVFSIFKAKRVLALLQQAVDSHDGRG